MSFFIRFKHQLMRTRPDMIVRLENKVTQAIREAGGKIITDHGLHKAVFNENSPGFWLDMLILLENVILAVNENANDLYGYSLLIGKSMPNMTAHLCRVLACGEGGAYFDRETAESLKPYLAIEHQKDDGDLPAPEGRYGEKAFVRLKEAKLFIPTAGVGFSLRDTITSQPDWGQNPSVLISGQSFEGKRDDLYRCIANEGFLPLFIRFGSGGLNALTDAYAGWMRSQNSNGALNASINAAWELLFRHRLSDSVTPFAIKTARRFFSMLLALYIDLAGQAGAKPVIILEKVHAAEHDAAEIVINALQNRKDIILLATCTGEIVFGEIRKWKDLFPRVLRAKTDVLAQDRPPNLPQDLWEIGYLFDLLGRFFPPDMLCALLEETGKKTVVVQRAVALLQTLKAIDTPLDPRPWHRDFRQQAEVALGERKEQMWAAVRSLLLAWVGKRKIAPCFRLLEIMAEIGGGEKIDDSLILAALHSDLACCGYSSIRRYSESITDPARGPVFDYIAEALAALHTGSAKSFRKINMSPFPGGNIASPLKAEILINRSLCFLAVRDYESTMDTIKEAAPFCRESGDSCLSHYYRIFALASLSKRKINETIDYTGFALENAAKSGNSYDIGITTYYAASIQLLYGNISRSRILAEKAYRHFIKAGSPEWADRSRFLEGRIAFETGSYPQAKEIFEEILENPCGVKSEEKISLLEAWAYRTRVFNQDPSSPRPQNSSASTGACDADLFEIEAMYLNGDFTGASELSASCLNRYNLVFQLNDDYLATERPDWQSGFAQCESLFFPLNEIRERMLCAYRALALSGISRPDASIGTVKRTQGGGEEAVSTIQRVIRSGQFPEIDPSDAFYFYAWYSVLEHNGADQVDISPAAGMAYKRLLSRASRIDDMETRRQYLNRPRWNNALGQAAKNFKLV